MVAQIDRKYLSFGIKRVWPRFLAYLIFEGRPVTTRFRWLNIIVFTVAKCLRLLPQLHKVQKPAFIIGTGRSGTTILGIVLSMHKEVGFLNEPKAVWAGLHEFDDLIGSYNNAPGRYRFSSIDATTSIIKGAHKIMGGYLKFSATNRLIEKYPEEIFRTDFIQAIFPDAHFLFLSRSGVETCCSISAWSKRLGKIKNSETHDWWGVNDRKWKLLVEQLIPDHPDLAKHISSMSTLNHEARAAVEWIITMREGMNFVNSNPSRALHVPYAALCENPTLWSVKIQQFLNLPRDHQFEKYASAVLSLDNKESKLSLPNWLIPIFNRTQAELDQFSS